MERIKTYLEYRRNRKIAKRELARIAATALPTVNKISSMTGDIARFVVKLTDATKSMNGDELVTKVFDEVAGILKTDNNRIIEVLSYMANLQPEDIQKIIVHSMVETLPQEKNNA